MSEVIVVTSGKGGVGKTTTTANVGTGLAAAGKKVVLIDTDIGLRNLDVVMGLENRIVYHLVDVVEGSCRVKQALIRDKRWPGLYLLPSAQTRDKTSVNESQMKKLVEHLREQFDYVLLDCPAGIEQGFKNAVAGADRALVVTTPEVSAIRDADRIIGLLEASCIDRIDLVVNRMRYDMVKRGDMMSVDDVVDILSVPLIGVVPDDENVVVATNQGEPLVGNHTLAGRAYRNICQRILGDLSQKSGGTHMRLPKFLQRKSSREVAKDRLKILLISDRVNCSPEVLDMIKKDIAAVISRYMKIDTQNMEIQISKASSRSRGDKSVSLHANVPILDLHKIS